MGLKLIVFELVLMKVVRSGDLVSYCAEEGVRILGEGKFLVSDSFPGNERTKYCLTSKVITTGITMIYALRFSLLGLVVTICSVDGGTSEIVIFLRMKLHTIKFNLASFTFFKLLFYVGNLECA